MSDLGICDVCAKRIEHPYHVQPKWNAHVHTWCRISCRLAVEHALAKWARSRKND